jgi:hypothetical protein
MAAMGYSGPRRTLIHEKILKTKISCPTPFKKKNIEFWIYSVDGKFFFK